MRRPNAGFPGQDDRLGARDGRDLRGTISDFPGLEDRMLARDGGGYARINLAPVRMTVVRHGWRGIGSTYFLIASVARYTGAMRNTSQFLLDGQVLPDNPPSMVPSVAISPSSELFAVSCKNANRVYVYDLASRAVKRDYSNPSGCFDHPHALAMTDRFVIVGNKMDPEDRPATLLVFDIDSPAAEPVCQLVTPVPELREAHSMSLHGDRLLVTYSGTGPGALASYAFDHDTGQIGEMLDISMDWFAGFGAPKGVSFNAAGDRALVSVVSVKAIKSTLSQKLGRARWMLSQEQGAARLRRMLGGKLRELLTRGRMSTGEDTTQGNGIALFEVGTSGQLSRQPVAVQEMPHYCRMENIHAMGQHCVVADPMRGEVKLFELDNTGLPGRELQALKDGLSFPHDAAIAADGKTLLVSNYGLRVENEKPLWHQFTDPRSDSVSVFLAAEAAV